MLLSVAAAGLTWGSTGRAVDRMLVAMRCVCRIREIRVLLLAVESTEGPSCQLHVGPHGEGGLVLASRQVELTGGRQQISKVGVPAGITAGEAQERKCFSRLARRRQGQAQIDSNPLIVGASFAAVLRAFSASDHRLCK